MTGLRRLWLILGATFVVLAAAPAAGATCGWPGYSYAGVLGERPASTIAATVTALRSAHVQSGHVAAWIGVGGSGVGSGGQAAWLQTGLVARPGELQTLYVEWKRPGVPRRYAVVSAAVPVGARHTLVVRELAGRRSVWRAYVDGRPVSPPVLLPRSHGRLPGIATAESWDGGRPACNEFAFRYEDVRMSAGGVPVALLELEDPGYRVERSERATFVARSLRRRGATR
jgi:hypothetical protein